MGIYNKMKYFIAVALLFSLTEAIHVQQKGIDKDDLMQNQDRHWTKDWPQGAVDAGQLDAEVISMFLPSLDRKKRKDHGPKESYPYTLDEDVIDTQESLGTSEKLTGKKLSAAGVKEKGLNWIFHYDNTA